MGCSLKVVFIIGILQYLENCQFSPGSSTNDDKILKITKELNQIIANFKVKPFYMFQVNNNNNSNNNNSDSDKRYELSN